MDQELGPARRLLAVAAGQGDPLRQVGTVGEISVPRVDVRLEVVEMGYLWRPRINPKCSVDQLRLVTSAGPLVREVHSIKNGQEVIDRICDNLA